MSEITRRAEGYDMSIDEPRNRHVVGTCRHDRHIDGRGVLDGILSGDLKEAEHED